MNKNKYQIILMCVLFFLIVSCDSLKRGLTNQKEKSTDEFLVKKKDAHFSTRLSKASITRGKSF